MVERKLSACIVIGAAAISSHAFAQEARKLSFGLSADVEYQSNVNRSSKAQAALQGVSRSDTIFTPGATVELLVPVGRQVLFLDGSAGYSFYNRNDQFDRERLDFTGGVRGSVGRCLATLSGAYSRGLNQIDDPLLIDRVDNVRERKTAGIDVACSTGSGIGVVAGASREQTENDLSFLAPADSETNSYNLGLTYARPALGKLTGFGNYQDTSYPNRPIGGGYELTSLGLTYERQLGARIQGTGTIAYTRVKPQGLQAVPTQSQDIFNNPTYSFSLSYRASDRLSAMATFDRAVSPSSNLGGTYDLSSAYRLSGTYKLGSRISFGLGGSWVEREAGAGAVGLPLVFTESTTKTIFGSVRYQQSKRWGLVLSATRDERETNTPQFSYTNNLVSLRTDVTF